MCVFTPLIMLYILSVLADTSIIKRENITGCYDESTTLKLNLNTFTLTLELNPTNKTECHALEHAVQLNLTIQANGYLCDNISLLLLDFYYNNTTTIEFNFYKDTANVYNIDDIFCNPNIDANDRLQQMPEVTFAIVNIFTHSHLVTVPVMEYVQSKTDIKKCFSEIQAVMQDDYTISVRLLPTLVCKNLINKKPTSPPYDNYISSIEFFFGDVSFILDQTQMDHLIDNYDKLSEGTATLTNEIKAKTIAQLENIDVQMKLTTIQNGIQVPIIYKVNFSQVSIKPFFRDSIYTASEGAMYFKFHVDENTVNEINSNQNKKFTSYRLMLIISQGIDYITYQKVFDSNQYNINENLWIINCDTMTGFQEQECLKYSEIMRKTQSLDVQLQASFYDQNNNFLFHEQVHMVQLVSCISELEVRYVNNSVIVGQYFQEKSNTCLKYSNYTPYSSFLIILDVKHTGDDAELYLINDDIKNLSTAFFRCVPGIICNLNKRYIRLAQQNNVLLGIKMSGPNGESITFAATAAKITLQNDNIVSYSSIGIGAASLMFCLIMTLQGMVMTMKRVKLIKKKKIQL